MQFSRKFVHLQVVERIRPNKSRERKTKALIFLNGRRRQKTTGYNPPPNPELYAA
jgi:hypothetical protein